MRGVGPPFNPIPYDWEEKENYTKNYNQEGKEKEKIKEGKKTKKE